jgi:hypothetical protein
LRDGTCASYPGNYADYQAHLAAQTVARPQTPSAKKPPRSAPPSRPRPARRRKPGVIEQEISHLEAELAAVQEAIAAHNGTEWQRLAELSTQQGTLAARLEGLMAEWEESLTAEGG